MEKSSAVTVTVIGAGRVGLPLAANLAEKGKLVTIVDTNTDILDSVNAGEATFFEPGLDDLLAEVSFTSLSTRVEMQTDYYVLTVGTPLEERGTVKVDHIFAIVDDLVDGGFLDGSTLVLRSTVPLGFTKRLSDYITRRDSTLVDGDTFFIAFVPERLAEGKALEEMSTLPLLVGAEHPCHLNIALDLFGMPKVLVRTMSPLDAEFAKLMCNSARNAHFAISNELAMAAWRIGVNYKQILADASLDYPRLDFMAGPGLTAGSCLRKDPHIMNIGVDVPFMVAAQDANEAYAREIASIAISILDEHEFTKHIGIHGMGMKPGSDDIRDSHAVRICKELNQRGVFPDIHDSYIDDKEFSQYGTPVDSPADLFGEERLTIIGSPGNFNKYSGLIIDPWMKANRGLIYYKGAGR